MKIDISASLPKTKLQIIQIIKHYKEAKTHESDIIS